MILSLYARGMTTRDIQAHLAEVYGAEVSPALISNVTSVVAEDMTAWQTRPLDAVYPILYIDALTVKVRDGGTVDNKAAHLAIGVDYDGYKHVLGIWLAAAEGASFWMGVLTELRNRGIKDVLFVCCDGLGGLPEAMSRPPDPRRSCRPASSTSSAPRCGTSPTTTARRSPPRCARSTPPSTRPPRKTPSSSCAECTASATPACWPPGTGPGGSSSRSWNSTPRSAR